MKNQSTAKISVPVLISFMLTILPLFTTSLLTAWAVSHEEWLRSWPFIWWLPVTAGLMLSSALAFTPPTFLALVYGYFLGWVALPLLFVMNLGAILIIFGLSHFFEMDTLRLYLIKIYPKARLMLDKFQDNQIRLIFFTKLSPILPFSVTNVFFCVAGARLRHVLTGGTLGMIPRTILAVWAGIEAQDIRHLLEHPDEGFSTKVVIIGLIIASTVGIGYFFRDKKGDSIG